MKKRNIVIRWSFIFILVLNLNACKKEQSTVEEGMMAAGGNDPQLLDEVPEIPINEVVLHKSYSADIGKKKLKKNGDKPSNPSGKLISQREVHSPYNFASSDIWSMNRGVSTLTQSQPIAITNNILSYTLPPLSVYHFVLTTEPNTLPGVLEPTASVDVYPVPAEEEIHVTINQFNEPVSYDILDYKGMQIKEGVLDKVSNTIDLPKGESSIYLLRVYLEDEVVIKKVVLDK